MTETLQSLSPTLVRTKIRAPVKRLGLVRRSDLLDRLTDDRDRSLTLVHAPAGYGKTTLLLQWANEDPLRRFGWLTLDRSENDPVVFWRYIFAVFRVLVPGLADAAWYSLIRSSPDLEAVVTGLLNGLVDVPGRLVVVLDDYHLIHKPACHETVQFFVDHAPRSTQLALATRERPRLALSGVLADGLMTDIGRDDLRFSPEETRQAVGLVASSVPTEAAAAIHDRTEGWATGVYLAALTRSSHPETTTLATGTIRGLRRYLMDEMLDQLPTEDVAFLRRTSIIDRLNGDLCDHVTGRSDSAARLERLAEANLLLVPLDERSGWYRYHHLLQEALRGQLEQAGADNVRALNARAKEWWLANGEISEAIHHAIDAAQLIEAGELISANWLDYMLTGRLETVLGWLRSYPEEELLEYPPLLVTAAYTSAFRGDVRATRRYAHAATHASFSGSTPDGTASFASSVELLRATLGLDGVSDALEHAELATRLEPSDSPWRPLAVALVGTTRAALGDGANARVALIEATKTPTGPDGVATYALGQLSLLAAAEGDWAEAAEHAQRAIDLIEELGIENLLSSGASYAAAAAVAAHNGDAGLARQRLHAIAALQHSLSDAIPFDAFQIHLVVAETYLAMGDYRSAGIHAHEGAARLDALGDGGVLADRLDALLAELDRLDADVGAISSEGLDSFTARERQILGLLPTDLSLREIGHELYVSRNTAKTHVSHIYRKLGVSTRTAAVARARELGLIESSPP